MQRKKLHLQNHRLQAFNATLEQLEQRFEQQIKFIEDHHEIFKFPIHLVRRNLREKKRWLKATRELKGINRSKLC